MLASSLLSCDSAFRPDTQGTQNAIVTDAVSSESSSDSTDTQGDVTESTPTVPEKTELVLDEGVSESYDTLCSYLKQYPSLVSLKTGGTTLTANEYISLCEINPATSVVSKVEFEGSVLDLFSSEIDISSKVIADKDKFDSLLSHFPAGIKLVMCDCGYTNEEMGTLREKYTELDFAWRIYMGKWSLRTDDEAFSVMIYDDNYVRLTSEDIEVLRYCTNMYALDLGHQALTDLSVIGDMTSLRVLILADNKITDLTPLSKLENLQYLEL